MILRGAGGSGDCIKHTKCQRNLESRLEQKPHLAIAANVEYLVRGLHGEVDVAVLKDKNYVHFYECKSRDSSVAFNRAVKQFHRYVEAHPHQRVKGVYVTPTKVRRLK